jgi:hypothetical protein
LLFSKWDDPKSRYYRKQDDKTKLVIPFDLHYDAKMFERYINNTEWRDIKGGHTRTDKALEIANKTVRIILYRAGLTLDFSLLAAARNDTAKVPLANTLYIYTRLNDIYDIRKNTSSSRGFQGPAIIYGGGWHRREKFFLVNILLSATTKKSKKFLHNLNYHDC